MNRMLAAAFAVAALTGVSSAHAEYTVDRCPDVNGKDAVLAFNSAGAQVQYTDTQSNWSSGTYANASNGLTSFITLPGLAIELRASNPNDNAVSAHWTTSDGKGGDMNCNSVYSNDYIAPAIWRPVATPPVLVAPNASVVTNHVPVTIKDHTAYAHVLVGGIETTSIVDSGMTFMNVNTSVADRLMASGQAKDGGFVDTTYADGRKDQVRVIRIKTVTIGGHEVHDVQASVVADGIDTLLGFDVLSKVTGKFGINVANATLDFD